MLFGVQKPSNIAKGSAFLLGSKIVIVLED
jgi:hypothetical protein